MPASDVEKQIAAMNKKSNKSQKADEKKAEEKKVEEKKTEEKKVEEKKADEKKVEDKKSEAKKVDDKKGDEKKSEDKKSEEKKPEDKKADDKPKFTLQLSSFQDKSEAQAYLDSIKSAGYHAYVSEGAVDGKQYFRVRLGSYRTMEAANDAKAEVEKATKKSAVVMKL